jgi:RNA polymerase sigma-70 factor (ECF subfamily)
MTLGPTDSTTDLLDAAKQGDTAAYERLFERQAAWLRRAARGRLPAGARDRNDTTDIVHETLISVFARIARFVPSRSGALRAYIWQALRNRVRDEARRVRAGPTTTNPDLDRLPSPGSSPFETAVAGEVNGRVRRALATLGERDRLALIARQHLEYSYAQTAAAVGARSPEAARKIVTRALTRLAEQMARDEMRPPR